MAMKDRSSSSPTSSMIRYFPAMSVPGFRTRRGDSRVFVRDAASGPDGPNGAAQLPQNLDVSLFTAWHRGHSTITTLPYVSASLPLLSPILRFSCVMSFSIARRQFQLPQQLLETWIAATQIGINSSGFWNRQGHFLTNGNEPGVPEQGIKISQRGGETGQARVVRRGTLLAPTTA